MKALFSFLLCLAVVKALYEDHVGSVDWYRQFLGPVDYVSLDGATPQGCKRVLVASRDGVVASIDAETGELDWRHVYERDSDGVIDAVLRSKWGLVTVSRQGQLLRSWDVSSGTLRWESLTGLGYEGEGEEQLKYPLVAEWKPGAVVATISGTTSETLVVAVGMEVAGFKGRSGDRIWKTKLDFGPSSDAVISLVNSTDESHLGILSSSVNNNILVHRVTIAEGVVEKWAEFPAPWLKDTSSCGMMSGGVVVCLNVEEQYIYHGSGVMFLKSDLESLAVSDVTSLQVSEDGTQFWLHSDHTHWLLGIHDNIVAVTTKTTDALLLESDESVTISVSWEVGGERDDGEWIQVMMKGERGEVGELSGRVRLTEQRGRPVQGDVYLTTDNDQRVNYQLVLLMEDSSIVMVTSPGVIQWVREDGLGSIVAMETIDLPPADQSGYITNFITMTKDEGNPLTLALMRLQLQLSLAKEFVKNLQTRGLPTLLTSSDDLLRDQFNIRKLLVVTTATGKLYALDSNTGNIIWQRMIRNIAPLDDGSYFMQLLRSTSHPPLPPLCILIGVSTSSMCGGRGQKVLYAFNPITGDHMTLDGDDVISGDSHMTCLGELKQLLVLPHLDHTHSHVLLYLTSDMKVHTFPSSQGATLTKGQQLFLYTADMESGLITGYLLERNDDNESLTARESWQLLYPLGYERISNIITKSKSEHISSPGRVMADRSVQYKYLNPHLFAVVTHGHDDAAGEKPFFTIYLVDGVTGATIHHTTHRNAVVPVNLVLSENWIVYHYYNVKLRRYELAVTELFEAPSNHTHTVWSSLSPPSSPIITSQAYTFPSSIVTMTTTQTKRALTYKSIIMGLHSGHIVSLPKRLLDPRRDVIPTDDMKEDGLPIYAPEMLLRPVMYINYNQTVTGLRSIHVATTGLESTCLVLAFGLDLFYTRVTPSKQFDLLAEDFDYTLIAAVVLGLVAGTIGLSCFSKRKSLRSLWK